MSSKLGNIQLVLGCMFSGKTSELIRRIQRYKSIQKKVLFVNFIEDYKSPGYIREDGRKNLQHNEQGRIDSRPWFNPEYDWDDEDGYAFCSREFS